MNPTFSKDEDIVKENESQNELDTIDLAEQPPANIDETISVTTVEKSRYSKRSFLLSKLLYELFRSILRQEVGWFDARKPGELSNRLVDDLDKIRDGIRYSYYLSNAKWIGIKKGLYVGLCQGVSNITTFTAFAITFWYGIHLGSNDCITYTAGTVVAV
ncbi:unnamed protein product, partial [Didymodactylos carnosus]